MIPFVAILLFAAVAVVVTRRSWRLAEEEARKFAADKGLEIVELKKRWFDRGPFDVNWRNLSLYEIAEARIRDEEGFVSNAWLLVADGKNPPDKRSVTLIWHDQHRNGERA